jgi:uncharacterized protein YdeI (YjbR/CyaY-like superfamily)
MVKFKKLPIDMKITKVSSGVAHKLPADFKKLITSSSKIHAGWEDITPLARNEWICWIISAKKDETRTRRMKIFVDKLSKGDRRPCCWQGCCHR